MDLVALTFNTAKRGVVKVIKGLDFQRLRHMASLANRPQFTARYNARRTLFIG